MSVEVGDIIEGKVLNIMQYGVFVQLDEEIKGLIHISEVSNKFVSDINTVLKKGQLVKVKVISNEKGKIALSIKQLEPKDNNANFKEKRFNNKREHHNNYNRESREDTQPKTFEDILSKFLKDSEERQVDIKRNFETKRGPSTKRM